jgi:hypothetical protein
MDQKIVEEFHKISKAINGLNSNQKELAERLKLFKNVSDVLRDLLDQNKALITYILFLTKIIQETNNETSIALINEANAVLHHLPDLNIPEKYMKVFLDNVLKDRDSLKTPQSRRPLLQLVTDEWIKDQDQTPPDLDQPEN